MKKRRLVFEDPRPITTYQGEGVLKPFIEELKNHPDKWAVFSRTSKGQSYYYKIQNEYPNLRITARQNPGRKTFTVYFMWENDEASAIRAEKRAQRKARRQANAKSDQSA